MWRKGTTVCRQHNTRNSVYKWMKAGERARGAIGNFNQRKSDTVWDRDRNTSLAMSCMYRGLVREGGIIRPCQRRIVFWLLISIKMRDRSPEWFFLPFFALTIFPSHFFFLLYYYSHFFLAFLVFRQTSWVCVCFLTCGVQTNWRYGASN